MLPLRSLLFGVLLMACGGRYEVIHRAARSPIGPRGEIFMREPKAGDLAVNGQPESAFVASLPPEEHASWNELLNSTRQGMAEGFMQHRGSLQLAKQGSAPEVILELKRFDLARQDPRGQAKATVRASLRILNANGSIADEIVFTSIVQAEAVTQEAIEATRQRRLHRAGVDLGRQAAEYLRDRGGVH